MSGSNLLKAVDDQGSGQDGYLPVAPRTVQDTGLPFLFIAQLVCKTFFITGPQRLADLAARVKLPAGVLEPVIDFLRRERLVEVTSSSTAISLVFALTELGRERTAEYLRMSQYVGPAPVSLEAYLTQIQRQTIVDLAVDRASVRDAFSGIVIGHRVLDQFGAAMNSGRAIFVYGPAGSGKSFIAEKLARLLKGEVHVPYAILVENQVIQVYDPLCHERIEAPRTERPSISHGITSDLRWVQCRRPVVTAGGELTLGLLDLRFDEGTRFYAAPPQLKANNGLFIIDDLGRQLVQPRDLMNRWIVPLDRRVDFLTLHTGEKFMVPFDVIVVFCTNLSPQELLDEAFLRRLGYKIPLGALDEAQYRAVCRQVCQSYQLPYTESAISYLVARFCREGRPLLACTPRDLLGQVRDQARYRGVPPELSRELLDWAWNNYFASENAAAIK